MRFASFLIALLFFSPWAMAQDASPSNHTILMEIASKEPPSAGNDLTTTIRLTRTSSGAAITLKQLETVHTQKLHLLIIDQSLSDFHHVHPEPTATPGEYTFTWTPALRANYRAFADITPTKTGQQEFAMAEFPLYTTYFAEDEIDRTERHIANIESYHFELKFDDDFKAGQATMGHLEVGNVIGIPMEKLEPLMGAYAHIIGFKDDFKTVMHVHPMGDEPSSESSRGGPTVDFHFAPEQPGFYRVIAHVKLDGRERFIPFGVQVK